jgi:hypothetical protein
MSILSKSFIQNKISNGTSYSDDNGWDCLVQGLPIGYLSKPFSLSYNIRTNITKSLTIGNYTISAILAKTLTIVYNTRNNLVKTFGISYNLGLILFELLVNLIRYRHGVELIKSKNISLLKNKMIAILKKKLNTESV